MLPVREYDFKSVLAFQNVDGSHLGAGLPHRHIIDQQRIASRSCDDLDGHFHSGLIRRELSGLRRGLRLFFYRRIFALLGFRAEASHYYKRQNQYATESVCHLLNHPLSLAAPSLWS